MERRWRETGDPQAEAEWLRESLRAGTIPRRRVELVARVGYPAARIVMGLAPVEDVGRQGLLLDSLAEAIVWCSDRPQETLKAEQLWTPELCDYQRYRDSCWHEGEELETALEQVRTRRRRSLRSSGWWPPDLQAVSLAGGRLIVCDPQATDVCGASEHLSGGLFDLYDVPAWDTWVGLLPGEDSQLLAWVPPALLPQAQEGIDVNPMECLWWADSPTESNQARPDGIPAYEP